MTDNPKATDGRELYVVEYRETTEDDWSADPTRCWHYADQAADDTAEYGAEQEEWAQYERAVHYLPADTIAARVLEGQLAVLDEIRARYVDGGNSVGFELEQKRVELRAALAQIGRRRAQASLHESSPGGDCCGGSDEKGGCVLAGDDQSGARQDVRRAARRVHSASRPRGTASTVTTELDIPKEPTDG